MEKFNNIENLRRFHKKRFIYLAFRSLTGKEPKEEDINSYLNIESPQQILDKLKGVEYSKTNSDSQPLSVIDAHFNFEESEQLSHLSSRAKEIYGELKYYLRKNKR